MKKYQYTLAVTIFAASFLSHHSYALDLEIVVENIQTVQGTLYISLYNAEQGFETNQHPLQRQKISVDKNTASVSFNDLPTGEYAVKTYHDVNDNGKMDFNGSGMPSEPFGSSNKSKELAPPTFKESKFTLAKNQQIKLTLLK
jgi:uncharacterized protein (DUF2141 family)